MMRRNGESFTIVFGALIVTVVGALIAGGVCWVKMTAAGVPDDVLTGEVQTWVGLGAAMVGAPAFFLAAVLP